MIITEITRKYGRSFNTRTYGAPESWVSLESVMTAQLESGDNAKQVSDFLYNEAKKNVIEEMGVLVENIKKAVAGNNTGASPAPSAPGAAPAPRPLS